MYHQKSFTTSKHYFLFDRLSAIPRCIEVLLFFSAEKGNRNQTAHFCCFSLSLRNFWRAVTVPKDQLHSSQTSFKDAVTFVVLSVYTLFIFLQEQIIRPHLKRASHCESSLGKFYQTTFQRATVYLCQAYFYRFDQSEAY